MLSLFNYITLYYTALSQLRMLGGKVLYRITINTSSRLRIITILANKVNYSTLISIIFTYILSLL